MTEPVYAGYASNTPCATITLDLTVNGELLHIKTRFPLDYWDYIGEERRMDVLLGFVSSATTEIFERFGDQIKVVRDDG